ncbi:MAG: type II toxin-antitoxin system HicB family antitoxin [Phycisphaerales bacterium]|nr:type II toxin-antitoxin system HicB family antitoxin [Phycisphaerales bacterium]
MSTSEKRSRSSRSTRKARKPKTVTPGSLRSAEALASNYTFVLSPHAEEGFMGQFIEFPGVWGFARTPEACFVETRSLLVSTIGAMIDEGEVLPSPASDDNRSKQVNIRLTELEKLRIEAVARQMGFRSISDYIRAAALSKPA